MKKNVKRYKMYIIVLLFITIICSINVSLATVTTGLEGWAENNIKQAGEVMKALNVTEEDIEARRRDETWDELWDRYINKDTLPEDKKLSNADIVRLYLGPLEQEYYGGGGEVYGSGDIRAPHLENIGNLVQQRIEAGNNPPEILPEETYESVRKKALDYYQDAANKNKTKEERIQAAKNCRAEAEKALYLDPNKTRTDEDLEYKYNQAAIILGELTGETPENAFDDNQLGSDGSIGDDKGDKIYKWPTISKNPGESKDGTLKDMIEDGDNFINAADTDKINTKKLQNLTGNIYNILLEIGVGLSVIIGLILGIKFMLSGVEEKAEVKKMLWIYVLGCIVTFGAFGIWKLVVTILENL